MTHSFDWNDLRYFLAVQRERTLAGAARRLRVQHSTVGRRLEVLEAALGATLFNRTPEGYVLTGAGSAILAFAEEAERALAQVERRARATDERIAGVVRLTASKSFSGLLVRSLAVLRERHPDLVVEILTGNRAFDLARGEADLALRIAPTTQMDLTCKHIGDVGWSMYASEAYIARRGRPAAATDLAGHEIIGFDESLAQVPGALWLGKHAAGGQMIMRGNSLIAVLNAALIGMGIAVVPCFLADPEPTLRRLVPEVLGSREVWLVFHPDVARIARVRLVIDFVTETVRGAAMRLRGEPGDVEPAAPAPANSRG